MKKFIRALIAIIILILIVVIFIIGCLLYFFDPNKIKPIIINEITQNTGYQIKIEDKLTWSFYPVLGIKAKHITLTSKGETIPFADMRNVTFVTEARQIVHGYQNLQGDIRINEIYFLKMHAKDAHVGLHKNADVLILEPITASLYNGDLTASARINYINRIPHWNWEAQVKQIQLKQLLVDLNGGNSKIAVSGVTTLTTKGETLGQNKNEMLSNMVGTAKLNVTNGVVEGLDLNYLMQTADDLINKRPITLPQTLTQTQFESLSANFNITHGVIATSDLLMDSNSFITKGYGRIDLINQLQSWQLQVVPIQPEKIKWMIPVIIEGTLKAPTVRLDMQLINAIITKEQIEKVKQKVEEKIRELPNKANKFLQRLLKR